MAAVAGALAPGCSGGGSVEAPDGPPAAPPETYVAVGASESVGAGADRPLVDAWPRVLYRASLDCNTVFVSAGVEGSTVAEALDEQLPLAIEVRPTVVTVWLNVNDLAAGVQVATYEEQLTRLVRTLRRDGRSRVLVANTLRSVRRRDGPRTDASAVVWRATLGIERLTVWGTRRVFRAP